MRQRARPSAPDHALSVLTRATSAWIVEKTARSTLPTGMPEDQHCRAHQAVRDRNHRITARRRDELGLKVWWRGQHAADDDATAYHDGATQVRRAYSRNEVRERR
jgi:hypothetical protein